MVPIRISAWVLALSRLTWVVAPLPIRSLKRLKSRCAPSSWAWSFASMPSACSICASIWRASSVNKRSPALTLAPSSKWTETMVVSSRDFSATLEIGVTVPIESTSTGTDLRSALANSTEIVRGRCGPWALAPPPIQDVRVTKAATAAMPRAPAIKIRLRFFIIVHVRRSQKIGTAVFLPLDGEFYALFLNGYHSLAAHGMPHNRKCVVTIPGLFHAYCYVERQFDPAAARSSPDLAEGLLARNRLPAGNQMCRRGVSAAGDRGARLQRRHPRPENV